MLSSLPVRCALFVAIVILLFPCLASAVDADNSEPAGAMVNSDNVNTADVEKIYDVEEKYDPSFYSQVLTDYRKYYSSRDFYKVIATLGVAAVMAHSSIDSDIAQESLNEDNSSHEVNEFFESSNSFGDYFQFAYAVPIYLSTMWLGDMLSGSTVGESQIAIWGDRSMRTLLLGAPQQLMLSYATGSQRPDEGDSDWDPFNDNNGVSGHAFYGAIPLLTAARMVDNNYLKYSLYVASTLPGLARVNKNKHYMSQVLLGWSLAFFSNASIFFNSDENKIRARIVTQQKTVLVGIEIDL